jgi:hypothetical protein
MTVALEGGEWSAACPGRTLPPGKTRYPLYKRLGGSQGRSGQARKISPPPGFDPRTIQPVVQSLYRLSYPAHVVIYSIQNYLCFDRYWFNVCTADLSQKWGNSYVTWVIQSYYRFRNATATQKFVITYTLIGNASKIQDEEIKTTRHTWEITCNNDSSNTRLLGNQTATLGKLMCFIK